MEEISPKYAALKYLEEYKVNEIFEVLMSRILIVKPNDPEEFLISELQKMQESKSISNHVYNKTDFNTLFDSFDVTNTGFINRDQLTEGDLLFTFFFHLYI